MSARYAIYYVPPRGSPLAAFGAAAIGYDIWQRKPVPLLPLEAYAQRGDILTSEPRRYGFHATLKAPFALKQGSSALALEAHVARLASSRSAVPLARMEVQCLSGFVALVPSQPPASLSALAARCVEDFDAYRAPPSAQDLARRLAKGLSARQRILLETWGYPYVLDEFRFHLTLTGPAEPHDLHRLHADLADHWNRIAAPVTIDSLSLVMQPAPDQPFSVMSCFPLAPAVPR